MDVIAELPQRRGDRPATTSTFPHRQLDQQPDDPTVREELARLAFSLEHVVERDSVVSVPGARALVLVDDQPAGPHDAFIRGREFAHFHPDPDWSLHLALPEPAADIAIDRGWAELHLIARTEELPGSVVLVYAPRDRDEAEAVWTLVQASHEFALGLSRARRQQSGRKSIRSALSARRTRTARSGSTGSRWRRRPRWAPRAYRCQPSRS